MGSMRNCTTRLATALCFGLLAIGLAALQGCRHTEEGTPPTSQRAERDTVRIQPPACYRLQLTSEGAELDSLRAWLPAGALPQIVELDTTRTSPTGEGAVLYDAYSWFDGRRESRPFSVWRHREDGAIRLQRPGALSGTLLDLRPDRGTLSGAVAVYRDAGMRGRPTRREGTVQAVPVSCPDT